MNGPGRDAGGFRSSSAVSLGDGLRQAIQQLGLSPMFRAHRALALWQRAVAEVAGQKAVAHTRAVRLQDGTLVVAVAEDAWRHRLLMDRETLRGLMNTWLESETIRTIRFVNQAD